MLTVKKAQCVLKKGQFYFPANKKYDGKGTVNCDFCNRTNIASCIGYHSHDICLICSHDLTDNDNNNCKAIADLPLPHPSAVEIDPDMICTMMMTDYTRPEIHTYMMTEHARPVTNMFNPHTRPVTNMFNPHTRPVTDMFNPHTRPH